MSTAILINNVDYFDMFKNYDNYIIRSNSEPTSNNVFTKFGKIAGKTARFFQKTETKISSMIAFWSVETAIYITLAFTIASLLPLTLLTAWYAYETYVIFSAIEGLTK